MPVLKYKDPSSGQWIPLTGSSVGGGGATELTVADTPTLDLSVAGDGSAATPYEISGEGRVEIHIGPDDPTPTNPYATIWINTAPVVPPVPSGPVMVLHVPAAADIGMAVPITWEVTDPAYVLDPVCVALKDATGGWLATYPPITVTAPLTGTFTTPTNTLAGDTEVSLLDAPGDVNGPVSTPLSDPVTMLFEQDWSGQDQPEGT